MKRPNELRRISSGKSGENGCRAPSVVLSKCTSRQTSFFVVWSSFLPFSLAKVTNFGNFLRRFFWSDFLGGQKRSDERQKKILFSNQIPKNKFLLPVFFRQTNACHHSFSLPISLTKVTNFGNFLRRFFWTNFLRGLKRSDERQKKILFTKQIL